MLTPSFVLIVSMVLAPKVEFPAAAIAVLDAPIMARPATPAVAASTWRRVAIASKECEIICRSQNVTLD